MEQISLGKAKHKPSDILSGDFSRIRKKRQGMPFPRSCAALGAQAHGNETRSACREQVQASGISQGLFQKRVSSGFLIMVKSVPA